MGCDDSLSVTSFTSTLNGGLALTQVDESGSKTSPVRDTGEQQFGSLVQLVVEALLSNVQDISDVRHAKEVLHIVQAISLSIRVRQLGIDLRFAERLASHLEVTDEIVLLASTVSNLDDFGIVGRILSLDVRV